MIFRHDVCIPVMLVRIALHAITHWAMVANHANCGAMASAPKNQAAKAEKDVLERKSSAISRDILLFLIAFRILNALSIKTFFQPDEYFQSLEPAWQMAFGLNSGPWITWVSQIFPSLLTKSPVPILTIGRRSGRTIFGPPSILPFSLASTGFHVLYPEPQGCRRTLMPSFWSQRPK